jgi:glycosyltransferase involved in cell wall biosynthesis
MDSPSFPEVSVIVPLYNEAAIVFEMISRIRRAVETTGKSHEIIAVDDGSDDGTGDKAAEAGAKVIRHPYNIGNGAAVKSGIRQARGRILVMLDGDGQHQPEDIPRLLEKINAYDMVVGARSGDSISSIHRDVANGIYNLFASYVCGRKIKDLTSGFRAVRAEVARQFVTLLPNAFSYPTTITLAVVHSGYSLAYVPIKTVRRVGKSKIKLLRDGSRFFLVIFKITTFYSPLKIFLPLSLLMFFTGFLYGLYRVLALNTRYGPTSALLMVVAVLIFMVGLVSEQISQLRFDRNDSGNVKGSPGDGEGER